MYAFSNLSWTCFEDVKDTGFERLENNLFLLLKKLVCVWCYNICLEKCGTSVLKRKSCWCECEKLAGIFFKSSNKLLFSVLFFKSSNKLLVNVCHLHQVPILVIYSAVRRAVQNLVEPDQLVSDAVDVRTELDLRIGKRCSSFFLCACMCLCVCVCVCVCVSMCVCLCEHVCVCVCVSLLVCVLLVCDVCMYVCACPCVCRQ